ncbi:oxidoreductase domain-containing protein [Lindgomyces ingoldianus]|uniref:Oxidoreductase domain-containing protein n=1 Tax=Lindgomyces ingoldianus TaxID=673940 RepID=A0ACB6QKV1_9PLEO|nr:oxidoreductase domain-containing protein [Lindgomyces ingoldianus]KAF2467155.1 oxidoreductase domain-containing protein [Lindgomyces ingoldianus]
MFAYYHFLKRVLSIFYPPIAPKSNEVLRFGILGAADIAPSALVTPAKSHPEVIVAAVAAREEKKAKAFAKKHGIPAVHLCYDDLIADPTINCVYVPLPNGLHYEWALKALKAGKHVLLEKPSVSNAAEAKSLFRHPILRDSDALVLLEAFHYRFHPAWQLFLTLFDSKEIEEVEVQNYLAAGIFPLDDIRFNYSLSGGTLMDFGSYAISAVRQIFGAEPTFVRSASYRPMPEGFDQTVDEAVYATYEFPNGGIARITADLQARGGYWFPALTKNWPRLYGALPTLFLKLKPIEEAVGNGLVKETRRKIVFHCYMGPHFYHRIDIGTTTKIIDPNKGRKILKSEKKTEYKKAYNWLKNEEGKKGELWWTTYRYQLEEFVNRVKKRQGSCVWFDSEESIRQMEMIDATYEKMGLPLRLTSKELEGGS